MKRVYDSGGEYLGNEWVDLSGLQTDTKKAILQMIYLDETASLSVRRIGNLQSSWCTSGSPMPPCKPTKVK